MNINTVGIIYKVCVELNEISNCRAISALQICSNGNGLNDCVGIANSLIL
jgi:hypothetical protein